MRDAGLYLFFIIALLAYQYDTEIRCLLGNEQSCVKMQQVDVKGLPTPSK